MIVLVLILLIVIVTLAGFNKQSFFDRFSFWIRGIINYKQYERIITSIFLHIDYLHLFFNLFSFYSFAVHLEKSFGNIFLLIIFFGSGIMGNLLALLIHRKRGDYRAAGASGAIAGVIFSSVLIFPTAKIIIFPIPIGMPPWLFAIIFVFVSLYGIGRQAGNIGHEAHLGGALTGILLTIWIHPWVFQNNLILTLVLLIAVLIFFFNYLKNPGKSHFKHKDF